MRRICYNIFVFVLAIIAAIFLSIAFVSYAIMYMLLLMISDCLRYENLWRVNKILLNFIEESSEYDFEKYYKED